MQHTQNAECVWAGGGQRQDIWWEMENACEKEDFSFRFVIYSFITVNYCAPGDFKRMQITLNQCFTGTGDSVAPFKFKAQISGVKAMSQKKGGFF